MGDVFMDLEEGTERTKYICNSNSSLAIVSIATFLRRQVWKYSNAIKTESITLALKNSSARFRIIKVFS
jgi:hypothetical protein